MRIERRFTKESHGERAAYAEIDFRKAVSEIRNPDGSIASPAVAAKSDEDPGE